MSRVGKLPIKIPAEVKVDLEDSLIKIEGPKGLLERSLPKDITVELKEGEIIVRKKNDAIKNLHGLMRTLLFNMVMGVSKGFEKALELEGLGYNASVKGRNLNLNVGFSHSMVLPLPEGIDVRVDSPNKVIVKGIDKEQVGSFAAKIRSLRKCNPYKAKGIRYAGESIKRKVGKTGATGGSKGGRQKS